MSAPGFTRFLGIFLAVFAIMAGLFAVDLVLARLERAEVRADAKRHFEAGEKLRKSGAFGQAADEFRSAVSVARDNREYRVAWAQALLDAGNLDAASEQATELLTRDLSDGDANLILARVYAKQGRTADSTISYRRAIYGRWPPNSKHTRREVRWELTDFLSSQHASEELLAELLLLEAESPGDPAVERRIAHLYLRGGPAERAVPLFEDLLRRAPNDADAALGLAQARVAQGNCTLALPQWRLALRLQPDSSDAHEGFALCEKALAIDPLLRGLPLEQRIRRAFALLDNVVRSAGSCPPESLKHAQGLLQKRRALERDPNAPELLLEAAREVWNSGSCVKPASEDQKALSLLLR